MSLNGSESVLGQGTPSDWSDLRMEVTAGETRQEAATTILIQEMSCLWRGEACTGENP